VSVYQREEEGKKTGVPPDTSGVEGKKILQAPVISASRMTRGGEKKRGGERVSSDFSFDFLVGGRRREKKS